MALRYLVPGLAVAARLVAAQCSGTTTITSQAQASAFASCGTWKGDIWIGEKTKEDISISGLQHIDGSLLAKDVNKAFTSLSADSLQDISDTFGLQDITGLSTLSFPFLTDVDTFYWTGLPVLAGLNFDKSVTKSNILSIQNTGLESLDGIDLDEIDQLFLANNFFLDDVSMPLKTISGALAMSANGRDTKVDFPDLTLAYNMTFRNVSSLNMPKLAFVNGSAGFYSNFLDEIEIPKLKAVGKTLAFVSNGALTDISLDSLTSVGGGIQIANNTKLMKIDGFKKLTQVGGDIDMFGDFNSIDFPKLTLVVGAFNVQSTGSIQSDCNRYRAISGPNNDIRGKFYCQGGLEKVQGSSDSSGGGSSGNGAGSLLIPYATAIIGLVATVFGML